jgi:FAD/FMN-containing dehydrogenase
VIVGVDPDLAQKEPISTWARDYWNALHPYAEAGASINFMTEEGEERIKASYHDHYPRLRQVKQRNDPTNLFHVNQNIRPAIQAPPDRTDGETPCRRHTPSGM